jgi:hypothetical protein
MKLYADSSRPVELGARIGGGKEGDVYRTISHPGQACKLFRADPTGTPTERRLPAMLIRRPTTTSLGPDGEPQLCWPTEKVHHRGGRLAGFLMPLIDPQKSTAIHRITNPTDLADTTHMRTAGFRQWRYLIRAAANLAAAVSNLHPDIVIGDFNDNNILVSEQTWITLIDCDSMQLVDPRSGETFYCNTLRPEYLAPELTGLNVTHYRREPASDNFALAVHVHQLLLGGFHPFSGIWKGPGEMPPMTERIRGGMWHHQSAQLRPPLRAPDASALLPDKMIAMFHDAFVASAAQPHRRPSAARWHDALITLSRSLVTCRVKSEHWYPREKRSCPWCPLVSATMPVQPTPPPPRSASPTAAAPAPKAPRTMPPAPVAMSTPARPPTNARARIAVLATCAALAVIVAIILGSMAVNRFSGSSANESSTTDDPTALPTAAESTVVSPPAATGVVNYQPVVDDPRAAAVADLLNRYYSAINGHDYATMLSLYDPAGQLDPQNSDEAEALSKGVSTSHDDDAVVQSITNDSNEDGVDVDVTMRSQQSPGYGPAEAPDQTCDLWTLNYILTGSSAAGFRIWGASSSQPSSC